MHITRRTFVRNMGIAAACSFSLKGIGAVSGQSKLRRDFFPIPAEAYTDPLFSMTHKQFTSLLGHTFVMTSPDGNARKTTLAEVNEHDSMVNAASGVYGESFSLICVPAVSEEARLYQDVYEISSEELPTFSALVVPTSRRSREYEIVINHLTR